MMNSFMYSIRHPLRAVLLSLLGLLLLLGGCASIPGKVEKPNITLAGISVAKLGLLEQQFVLSLRVTNPNDFDIGLNGLTVNVELNKQAFAQGVSNEKVTLPRLGEKIVKLKVSTSLTQAFKQFSSLKGGAVPYRIYGKVYAPLLPAGMPFERQGQLSGLDELLKSTTEKF
ncbi:LEA type 2 family protein [Chitinibacter sp. GC72]|uniref:LEA type 2 family protein n=1 Tax=Chitinibacter sp. GC72 TaxID=1526917 RepID=UPI0012F91135|nr:LEA type 2 family protein [Chitinibacter sp. GC72]